MKKKYLTFFALLLSASIALSTHSTLAEDSAVPNSETPATNTTEPVAPPVDKSTLNLSLQDALKMMETGNSTLILMDSKLLILEKQTQQALARQNANSVVVDEDSKRERTFNHKQSQWILDNAQYDRENLVKSLKAQITNQYANILTLQQQANNLSKQLVNLNIVIDQINVQIDLGLKIPSEIHSYTARKSTLEAAQKAIQNNINSSMITLKQDLGIDINRNVVLTSSPIQYTKFNDSDLDNKIAEAIKNHYDFSKYERDIELTQMDYDIVFYYSGLMEANRIQLSNEDKKAKLEKLPVTLEVGYRTAYNTLKTLENTIEADKLTVEADQINLKVMLDKIKVGKASSLEMIDLQNTLLNSQYTLQQNINAYMTAVTNFKNSLETEFTPTSQSTPSTP